MCCLVASDLPYETAQRLLGFFCDDEKIISDHSIENIAMRCGADLRQHIAQTQNSDAETVPFVPSNRRKKKDWPEEIKEAAGDLIHQNNLDRIPEGLSRNDWMRAKQYYAENYEPSAAVNDEMLSRFSQLGAVPQPGELLIFIDEILVNNWEQTKYLQHLTGTLVSEAGIYYMSGEDLVAQIDALVKKINPQSITVIADGAKWITNQVYLGVLSSYVNKQLILDWYHLEKKAKDLLSMICYSKKQKNDVLSALLSDLWHGKVNEALTRLSVLVDHCRNQAKLTELRSYISSRKDSIPDYGLRRLNCQYNGSGIVEKANDLLVARRQKNTSMQWTRRGGDALLAFKTSILNNQWDSYWVHRGSAA